MSKKNLKIIIPVISFLVLAYSAYKDLQHPEQGGCDLRNRVVGSRLIHDGFSPYFYKWKTGDPVRYYDPENFDCLRVSCVTASPFFHQLIHPLAEWPQSKISLWWCAFQYLLFIAMIGMALANCQNDQQREAVLAFSTLFVLTDAWKISIYNGQYYLLFPFLAMFIYLVLKKGRNLIMAATAGLLSVMLVLIRANALVFFIPFIFLLNHYRRRWLISFFIPVLLLSGWTLIDRNEHFLWEQYSKSVREHIQHHQNLAPVVQPNDPDPGIPFWEGISKEKYSMYLDVQPIAIHPENGNFFYLFNIIFHRRIPVNVLLIISLVIIFMLTGIYYYLIRYYHPRKRHNTPDKAKGDFDLLQTALFGYSLYMISDLFSPIFRNQYYTVQVLFPLFYAASRYRPADKWVYSLLLTGILLNISHFPFIKMQHTIGEYLIVGVTTLLSLVPNNRVEANPKNPGYRKQLI